jgi:hypothetical protein
MHGVSLILLDYLWPLLKGADGGSSSRKTFQNLAIFFLNKFWRVFVAAVQKMEDFQEVRV